MHANTTSSSPSWTTRSGLVLPITPGERLGVGEPARAALPLLASIRRSPRPCGREAPATRCYPFATASVTVQIFNPEEAERPPRKSLQVRALREAGDRSRTGDLQLGKLTLYQLSYARMASF